VISQYLNPNKLVFWGISVTGGSLLGGIAVAQAAHWIRGPCKPEDADSDKTERIHLGSLSPLCIGSAITFFGLYLQFDPNRHGIFWLQHAFSNTALVNLSGITLLCGAAWGVSLAFGSPESNWQIGCKFVGLIGGAFCGAIGWLGTGCVATYKLASAAAGFFPGSRVVAGLAAMTTWAGLGYAYLKYGLNPKCGIEKNGAH
jgi:hypothetical protein